VPTFEDRSARLFQCAKANGALVTMIVVVIMIMIVVAVPVIIVMIMVVTMMMRFMVLVVIIVGFRHRSKSRSDAEGDKSDKRMFHSFSTVSPTLSVCDSAFFGQRLQGGRQQAQMAELLPCLTVLSDDGIRKVNRRSRVEAGTYSEEPLRESLRLNGSFGTSVDGRGGPLLDQQV
jgi:hypothetical protein